MYMVKAALAADVARLLAEGQTSQRAIAAVCHCSRGTVALIKSGKHWSQRPGAEPELDDQSIPPANALKIRCVCGALTALPCLVCRDRQALAKRPLPPCDERSARSLTLDLPPELEKLRRETRTAQLQDCVERSRQERVPIDLDPMFDQTAEAWQEPSSQRDPPEAGRAA